MSEQSTEKSTVGNQPKELVRVQVEVRLHEDGNTPIAVEIVMAPQAGIVNLGNTMAILLAQLRIALDVEVQRHNMVSNGPRVNPSTLWGCIVASQSHVYERVKTLDRTVLITTTDGPAKTSVRTDLR